MNQLTHKQFKKEALSDPRVKKAYDELEEEFELIAELIKARKKSGLSKLSPPLTQEQAPRKQEDDS